MSRLDTDLAHELARRVVGMVGHLLRDEEKPDLYREAFDAARQVMLKRDELLARQRKRLGLPSEG